MPNHQIAAGLVASLLLANCGPVAEPADAALADRPIRAVATVGMIADLVQNVGGERVHVTGLMGQGVDPHLYKASEGDVIRMGEADVVFYGGLHLEAAMTKVFERMRGRIRTVAVTDGIDRSLLIAPPEFAGNYDPHVWFDVKLWMKAAETVRDALTDLDPRHADLYRTNTQRYLAELSDLHRYVESQAARLPPEKRVLVTAHDAFNYFGRAYGFEVRGLQGISTSVEAGTLDVQELADLIAARELPAIFVETSVPQRNIEAVQAAVRARGFAVRIGGQLYSDSMGEAATPEGTYIGMLRHNIDVIVGALLQDEGYLQSPRWGEAATG